MKSNARGNTKPAIMLGVKSETRCGRNFILERDEGGEGVRETEKMKLEDRLFELGEMARAPCFCCGYNGPGYYQPEQHACAERYHRLVGVVKS